MKLYKVWRSGITDIEHTLFIWAADADEAFFKYGRSIDPKVISVQWTGKEDPNIIEGGLDGMEKRAKPVKEGGKETMSEFVKPTYGMNAARAIDYEWLKIDLLNWLNNQFDEASTNTRKKSLEKLLDALIEANIIQLADE